MILPDYYEILDIHRGATPAEIIQAHRLACSTYINGSQASYSMFDEEQLKEIRSDIEEAYKTLSNTEKRRLYDAMLTQNSTASSGSRGTVDENDKNVFYLKSADEANSESQPHYTGYNLKRIRKSRGISLEKLADRTGIQTRTLQAIEDEDMTRFDNPAELKAVVAQYAAVIGVDPSEVSSNYPLLKN